MSEKVINYILLKLVCFKRISKNIKNNILLFSKFSVSFNFVFKNYSHKIMPNTFILFLKTTDCFLIMMPNKP